MSRIVKQPSLIPLAPLGYKGKLTRKERECVAWQVLSNCSQMEAFTMFLHPELSTSPGVSSRLAKEFFGTKDVITFIEQYTQVVKDLSKPVEEDTPPPPPAPKVYVAKDRLPDETDKEYKERCKREAAESIVEKIIQRVDDVEDIDSLLDTIKAMEKTGFFNDDVHTDAPPLRYLPTTCNECAYKQFIDEQISLGNVEKKE